VSVGAALSGVERNLEALLFLAPEPVTAQVLADAIEVELDEAQEGLERLRAGYEAEGRGVVLRELGGGWGLSSHPETDEAARRLLARPRTPPLTAAQAETLAIVAYLQPVSRPEIARIRGVNAESAAGTLLERGLIEESGRSQFGAVLYQTTELFMRLFGLRTLDELPDVSAFDPSPELQEELRERLLRVGEMRAGPGESPGSPGSSAAPQDPGSDAPEDSGSDAPEGPRSDASEDPGSDAPAE
jgi:segregation and condensation protein B